MARIAGRTTKLSKYALKVYIGEEKMRYLKWLYKIRKKEQEVWINGKTGGYSMSRFLSEIIGLFIRDHWETIESMEKAMKEMKMKAKEDENKMGHFIQ